MLRAARSAALAEARNCKSAAMTEAETVAVGAAPVAAAAADAGTMVVEAGVSERLAGRDRGRHRKRKVPCNAGRRGLRYCGLTCGVVLGGWEVLRSASIYPFRQRSALLSCNPGRVPVAEEYVA